MNMYIYKGHLKDSYQAALYYMLPASLVILILNYVVLDLKILIVPDAVIKWFFYGVLLLMLIGFSYFKTRLFAMILGLLAVFDFTFAVYFPAINDVLFCSRYFLLTFAGLTGVFYWQKTHTLAPESYQYQAGSQYPKIHAALWIAALICSILNIFLAYTIITKNILPSLWAISTIFALLLVLYNLLPDHHPLKRPEEKKPERTKMTAPEIIESLKRDVSYRGQISSRWTVEKSGKNAQEQSADQVQGKAANGQDPSNHPGPDAVTRYPFLKEILHHLGIDHLYGHQEAVIGHLAPNNRKDILLGWSPGAGKSLLMDLGAVIKAMDPQCAENTLYITPNAPEERRRLFESRMDDTEIGCLLKAATLSQGTVDGFEKLKPDVIFSSPDAFRDCFLEHADEKLQWFTANLGLIVIENIDQYAPVTLTHLSYLLKSIRFILRKRNVPPPQIFITASSDLDLEGFCKQFLGEMVDNFKIFNSDTYPREEMTYISWCPPLNVKDPLGRINITSVKVERGSCIGEFNKLAKNFSIFKDLSVLLTIQDHELTDSEIATIRTEITDQFMSQYGAGLTLENYLFVRSLESSFQGIERSRKFDVIISLGLGQNPIRALDTARKVLVDQGLFIHVVMPSPLEHQTKMDPAARLAGPATRKSMYLLNDGKDSFLQTHLLPLIAKCELFEEPTEQELREMFGIDDRQNLFIRDFIKKGIIVKEEIDADRHAYLLDDQFRSAYQRVAVKNLQQFPGGRFIEMIDPDNMTVATLPEDIFLNNLYRNALWFYNGSRYRINSLSPISGKQFTQCDVLPVTHGSHSMLADRDYMIHTLPILSETEFDEKNAQIKAGIDGDQLKKKVGIGTFNLNGHSFTQIPISGLVEGCRKFDQPYQVKFEAHYCSWELKNTGGGKEAFSVAHACVHLLRLLLAQRIHQFDRLVAIVLDRNGRIFFLEKLGAGGRIVEDIYYNMSLDGLFSSMLNILMICPCSNGCPHCLQTVDCMEDPWNEQLDKAGLMRYLNQFLGNSAVKLDFQIECRTTGLPKTPSEKIRMAEELLNDQKIKVVEMLKDRFEMPIGSVAALLYVSDDSLSSKNILGQYSPSENTVKINHGEKELTTGSVIAHEYAHNWQYDPGCDQEQPNLAPWAEDPSLKFEGQILIEGFAQWVSYRYLDFLGADREMEEIDIRCDDKYGDGFDVMKYIEEKYGFYEVKRFIEGKSQQFPDLQSLKGIENATIIKIFS